MYSSIAHSCTNNTVVAGYHDSRRNTDTPYRSLWRYICSSFARAGVFPGIPVCPVYRFFLVLPLQAGRSGHRLYVEGDFDVWTCASVWKCFSHSTPLIPPTSPNCSGSHPYLSSSISLEQQCPENSIKQINEKDKKAVKEQSLRMFLSQSQYDQGENSPKHAC